MCGVRVGVSAQLGESERGASLRASHITHRASLLNGVCYGPEKEEKKELLAGSHQSNKLIVNRDQIGSKNSYNSP